ncbi:MAG: tetraacyldisaccharide 4'-kinase [Magnetococcales bacterium]|nr:tetraacyldisaccharide 4'-kinase [Magnetococcales bacterium]
MPPLRPLLDGSRPPADWLERRLLELLGTLGAGYGWIQAGRFWAYRKNLLTRWQGTCPVISVGNLTAGGTGKTPMVAWLGRFFLDRDVPLAIVSRGYRQRATGAVTVVADRKKRLLDAPEAADEAVLLAQELPGVAVLTGPDRRRLIHFATHHLGCRLAIMDDGFQHLPVRRDLDLLLLDAQTPWGNGRLLPGGILREFPEALRRADGILFTRAGDDFDPAAAAAMIHHIAPEIPTAHCHHEPRYWLDATRGEKHPLETLRNRNVLAFCGIGHPESFRALLVEQSVNPLDLIIFPDHHPVTSSQLRELARHAGILGATALVTTRKDLVKITTPPPDPPLFALDIGIRFPEPPPWLLERLERLAVRAIAP